MARASSARITQQGLHNGTPVYKVFKMPPFSDYLSARFLDRDNTPLAHSVQPDGESLTEYKEAFYANVFIYAKRHQIWVPIRQKTRLTAPQQP